MAVAMRLAAGLSDVSKLAVRGSTPLLRFAAEDLVAHAAPAPTGLRGWRRTTVSDCARGFKMKNRARFCPISHLSMCEMNAGANTGRVKPPCCGWNGLVSVIGNSALTIN